MTEFPQPQKVQTKSARDERIARELGERPKEYASKILDFVDEHLPTINESAFIKQVVPLLEKILVPANRKAYQRFVVDLMMPLKVVDDHDKTKVVHVVPALSRTPRTTIPQADGGLSVGDVIHNMNRYRDLHRIDLIDDTMRGFLQRITILPDTIDDILLPIHRILQVYGRELDVTADAKNPLGKDALPPSADVRGELVSTLSPPSSCFTDEEDED
jgi:hypothetical protein